MNLFISHQIDISVNQIRNGDATGLADIYRLAGKKMQALAYSILLDHYLAEDCVHDSLIKILNGAKDMKNTGKAYAWIMMVVRNTALDTLRKRKREEAAEDMSEITDEKMNISFSEDSIVLDEALRKLPEEDRQIVLLRAVSGFSYGDMELIIGKKPDAIRKQYKKAIENLKAYIS